MPNLWMLCRGFHLITSYTKTKQTMNSPEKNKAKELVEKFNEPTEQWDDGWKPDISLAKECAIICVDELIASKPSFEFWDSSTGTERRPNEEYWQSVKEQNTTAQDLRIGNWVIYGGAPKIIEMGAEIYSNKYNPIPLTPELLQKCGFKKYNNAWVPIDYNEKDYNRWRFTIWDQFDGEDLKYNSAEFQISLTSLHQLQNLYYALTGQELQIKL